ncbi:MAG: G5 domain-containing protein, partial [Chloroflexota bacterium]|nr:G5 domain-containing protein [Chloroflexota bacterium]
MIIILGLILGSTACSSPQVTPTHQAIEVQVYADGEEYKVQAPAGSTAQNVLDAVGLTLKGKDRVEPTASTILEKGMEVYLIRVEEIFETEQEEIPFRTIQQPNENLPEGDEQYLQTGKNGLNEITYLRVLENGKEVSRDIFSNAQIKEPVDQIILVGVQSSVAPIQLSGRLVYLSDDNAWMMEGSTANRSLIISTGDLDGRVFALSDDGQWLLFTRQDKSEDVINTLWAMKINGEEDLLIDLGVENVIHFADWVPDSNREVAYSTVESRLSSPGWQANNDLQILEFAINGWVHTKNRVLDTNYGGVYGWWGTDFAFSPQGDFLAYIGPDEVGTVNVEINEKELLLKITPYQTRGDWAWMSGIAVGPNGNAIYIVNHAPPEMVGDAESSPIFDLFAIPLTGGAPISLVPEVGMFAYPKPSPSQPL